jgi:hypothetical protein
MIVKLLNFFIVLATGIDKILSRLYYIMSSYIFIVIEQRIIDTYAEKQLS